MSKDEDIPKYSRILLVIILVSAFVMTIFATDVMSYISNVIGSLMPGIGVALLLGRFLETCYLARRNCNYFGLELFSEFVIY